MKAEQKMNLAKTIIVATAMVITTIVIVWLVVAHNPSSMKTLVNFETHTIEIDCMFYNQDAYLEN